MKLCITRIYGFTTVVQAASNVVPIIFGVSAAVGAATGLTSVGLQIAQHVQYQEQLKDQLELVQLQKELGRRQLEQYKTSEEVDERERNMLSRPVQGIGPVNRSNMMTRSMSRNVNMPDIVNPGYATGQINMGNLNTPFRNNFEDVSLRSGGSSQYMNSPRNSISLGGSFSSLAGEAFPLARLNPPRLHTGNTTSSSGSDSLFNAAAARAGRPMGGVSTAALNQRLDAIEAAQRHVVAGDQQVRFRNVGGGQLNPIALPRSASSPNLSQRPRHAGMPRPQFVRLAALGRMDYPNVGRAFMRAIKKHKRKILIGGAVIGTAALLAGSIYGGLSSNQELKTLKEQNQFLPSEPVGTKTRPTKKLATIHQLKKEAKSEEVKEDMQYAKPVGVFEKISSGEVSNAGIGGGGGSSSGGGYGAYQKAFQMGAPSFGRRQKKRRRSKKANSTKRRTRKASNTKIGTRKTRKGRVAKCRRSNKRINKRSKKTKRHSRKTAF